MNTIILRRVNIGNDAITKEIEGKKVVEFSAADNRRIVDSKGNKTEIVTWFRCSFWTSSNIENFLKKGATINIVGTLNAGAYMTKENKPAADLKITVKELDLLDKREGREDNGEQGRFDSDQYNAPARPSKKDDGDDWPF